MRTTWTALVRLKRERPGVSADRHKTPYANGIKCEACHMRNATEKHHIVRRQVRGAGGCECQANVMWICRKCHDLLDLVGRTTFFTVTFKALTGRLVAAIEHRDARNQPGNEMPCAPKRTRRPPAFDSNVNL